MITQANRGTPQNPTGSNRSAGIEEIYPLSPMQQGMLFHTLLAPDSGAYIVQMAYEIRGQLDRSAFDQAWQVLMQRHSILRSAFVWQNLEQPLQVVGQQCHCPILYHDWRQRAESPQQLAELKLGQRRQGFTLAKAPLMQVNLVQLTEQRYQLIWHYHHLLLDGWSMPILLQEFLALYQGRSLPPATPYRSYIAWLKAQSKEQAQLFWRSYLQDFTPPELFPRAILRGGGSANAAAAARTLSYRCEPSELGELPQLQAFAAQHQVTLSTLLQAAWGLLLSRYGDTQDLVVGIVSSGRPPGLAGVERMVGLFVNTLPLRLQPQMDLTVSDYVQQVHQQYLSLSRYESSSLIEIQSWSQVPRTQPLFETILVFENYPVLDNWQAGLGELEIELVEAREQTNYPLTLYATVDQSLNLELQYQSDRFSHRLIQQLLLQLKQVLLGLTNAATLGQIEVLTPDEQQRLSQWNQTERTIQPLTVVALFEQQIQQRPGAIALTVPEAAAQLTYRELGQLVNQIAAGLRAQGVETGERIGVCLGRSPHLVATLLAVLKVGALYVPLDRTHPPQRLRFILEDAQIHRLITDQMLETGLESVVQVPLAQLLATSPDLATPLDGVAAIALDQTAYILYTSGSTGQPKGVQISHGNLSNCLQSFQADLSVSAADVVLATTTIGFDIAGLELFLPLICGAQGVLLEGARNPELVMQALTAHGVTLMQATPATWHLLLSAGWSGQAQLTALCGGEAMEIPLAQALVQRCAAVWNVYGPTETTIWSSMQPVTAELLAELADTATVPIGQAIANTQFHLLDSQRQPVPIGAIGELYIAGHGVMQGYWQRPDLNATRLIHYRGHLCYATGDRACYDESGRLSYLGRIDEQIKLRGYRIEPGEIAAVMMQHPQVEQAVVCLAGAGEQVYLSGYYTCAPTPEAPHPTLSAEITAFIASQLPDYMVPRQLMQLDALPLNASGKVDRRALPQPGAAARVVELASTPLQQEIVEIWRVLLGIETVGLDDAFFDLGGHSLLMVRMQGQLAAKLNREIPLVELFRYPTVRALAAYLQQDAASGEAMTRQIQQRVMARQEGQQRLQQRRQLANRAQANSRQALSGEEESI
jgi:amino acid adenylation domain-containing protein